MFKSFFANRRWLHWSALGSAAILVVTWYKVQLDVRINEWFGDFYDTLQRALAEPGAVVFGDFLAKCLTFAEIAGIYITVAVLLEFFVPPLRLPLADRDERLLHVLLAPGASHRGRGPARAGGHDALRPHRRGAGRRVHAIGDDPLRLPPVALGSERARDRAALDREGRPLAGLSRDHLRRGRTVLLAVVGIKLPGLEFNNQKVEAAYRKELVYGEDHEERAEPETVAELFANVRKNYFRLYKHYLYFDIAKWSYLQFGVIVPYIMMGPTIVAGIITLGVLQQIPARVRPGRDLVPVPGELLVDDRRADLDLQASESVRVPDSSSTSRPARRVDRVRPWKPQGMTEAETGNRGLSPRGERSTPRSAHVLLDVVATLGERFRIPLAALGAEEVPAVDMERPGQARQRVVTEWMTSGPSGTASFEPSERAPCALRNPSSRPDWRRQKMLSSRPV